MIRKEKKRVWALGGAGVRELEGYDRKSRIRRARAGAKVA